MFREVILFLMINVYASFSYNVLSILRVPYKSHNIIATAVLEGLAARGHNITVYTTFPQYKERKNYYEIHLKSCFLRTHKLTIEELAERENILSKFHQYMNASRPSIEDFLHCDTLFNLLRNNFEPKFDVIITESFDSDITSTFSCQLRIPVVIIFPNVLFPHLAERMGSSANPSYIPSIYLGSTQITDSISKRVQNFFHYLIMNTYSSLRNGALLNVNLFDEMKQKPHLSQFISEAVPYDECIEKTSLMLTNSHFSYTSARPHAPGVIEIGGIHINETVSPLPKDIDKFLSESENGVVYFSLGSVAQAKSLPHHKLKIFLKALNNIPQRVLCKWDDDVPPFSRPGKIKFLKWMPQRDIFAHPNVKLFITHGGLLGTMEAIYESVPILGIPIFADQFNNLDAIQANGAGLILNYHDLRVTEMTEKIELIISNPNYKQSMQNLSYKFRDRPMSPVSAATYWIEYVIRHKGAQFLKPNSVKLPWYSCSLLDILFISVVPITVTVIIIIKRITKYCITVMSERCCMKRGQCLKIPQMKSILKRSDLLNIKKNKKQSVIS